MSVETIKIGNCVVEIIRPQLNEEERRKREAEVTEALAKFAYQRERERKNERSA